MIDRIGGMIARDQVCAPCAPYALDLLAQQAVAASFDQVAMACRHSTIATRATVQ